jgi:hypothetical protein
MDRRFLQVAVILILCVVGGCTQFSISTPTPPQETPTPDLAPAPEPTIVPPALIVTFIDKTGYIQI